MKVALDTNILAYAEGLAKMADDRPKVMASIALIRSLRFGDDPWIASAHMLGELHKVLVSKLGLSRAEAEQRVQQHASSALVVPSDRQVLSIAFDLATRHGTPTFDAIILTAAAEARCDVLYSEDFQRGFTWRGVEVVNPFRDAA